MSLINEAKSHSEMLAWDMLLPVEVKKAAYKILDLNKDSINSSNRPESLAGGAIYLASVCTGNTKDGFGIRTTQKEIGYYLGLRQSTISDNSKRLGQNCDAKMVF